jgi:hypothetical protein
VENPPDTFSASEVQHLLDVVADEEGRYPEAMREFAAVLLELLAGERPELLLVGPQLH